MIIDYAPFNYTPIMALGTSDPAYPETNLKNSAIRIPWRSGNTTVTNSIRFDLPSANPIHCIFLHDVNLSATDITLYLGRTLIDFDTIVLTADYDHTDNYGRTRIFYRPIAEGYTDNYEYVWIEIAADSSTRDGDVYRIGSVYIMSAEITVDNPRPGMPIEHIVPTTETVLANGARVAASAGPAYDTMTLDFDAIRDRAQFPDFYLNSALTFGPAIIDMEYHSYHAWPVIADAPETRTTLDQSIDRVSYSLRELVTI